MGMIVPNMGRKIEMKTNTKPSRPVLSANAVAAVAARTVRGQTFTPVPAEQRTGLTSVEALRALDIPDDTPKPTLLDVISDRAGEIKRSLCFIADRLESAGDRLTGPVPSGTGELKDDTPASLIGAINKTLGETESVIDRIIRATERIETL
jgi:hypothetical protein